METKTTSQASIIRFESRTTINRPIGDVFARLADLPVGFRETLRWFGSDVMEARPQYFLEADQERTIVHHVAEGKLFGWMRLMKPMAALMANSERARTVASLKRSLESN